MNRPRIAITMGDPAGVGPEVVMKALAHEDVYARCRPLVVGDLPRLVQAGRLVGSRLAVRTVSGPEEARFEAGTVDCIDLGLVAAGAPFGRVSAACGEAAYRYIELAVELARAHRVEAICTAPISKEALNAAGHHYPGHTELLAELTETPEVSLMLIAPKLRVIHVTTHMGLVDAIARIDAPLIERTIARGRELLARAGFEEPRIGVCGINPHAGEGGLFGREEMDEIAPAIEAAKAEGLEASGPYSPDTLFYRLKGGEFDAVVAMYHDQGHIPLKLIGFERGVNVTVGLPIIRTSVDHGTAFDIAGTGTANPRSMVEAILLAAKFAQGRRKTSGPTAAAHPQK